MATAMPIAARDLHGLSLYAWAFTGFLIASLYATAITGPITDRVGPYAPFLTGVLVFVVGMLVAGSATSMWMFVGGRMIQGLGGGAVIVALYVVVARVYDESVRPRIFSFMAAAWVVPSIVGPLVAGLVAEHWSWRLIFYGLAPFVVIPLLLTLPTVRPLTRSPDGVAAGVGAESGPSGSGINGPGISGPGPSRSVPGLRGWVRRIGRGWLALMVAVGAGFLQYAGQRAERADWLWVVPLGLAGLVLLALSLPPLLPPGTVRLRRGLPSVVALRGAMAGAFFGTETYIPLMLYEHRGLSASMAGLSLTGGALGWAAGSWFQGRPRLRTPRSRLVVIGASLATVGIGIAALAATPVPPWLAAVGWLVAGSGMGTTIACLSVLLFEMSPLADQGANSAALQIADALGSVVMIGAGGVLFALLHGAHAGTTVFLTIFAVMVAGGLFAILVATRVRLGGGAARP